MVAFVIGFKHTEYKLNESSGLSICAAVSGTLEKDVVISVSSSDGSANGTHTNHTFKLND